MHTIDYTIIGFYFMVLISLGSFAQTARPDEYFLAAEKFLVGAGVSGTPQSDNTGTMVIIFLHPGVIV